jgi:hypothetical protein
MRLIDIDDDRNCYIGFDGEYEKWNIDLDVLAEAKTVEPQRWIPIEDRLPEFGKDVLISHRGFVSIDWLTQSEGDAYFFASRVAIADIDAWMPLPKPWKAVKHDCI